MRARTAAVIIAVAVVALASLAAYWLLSGNGLNLGVGGKVMGNIVKVNEVDVYAVSGKSSPALTFVEAVVRYSVSVPNTLKVEVGGGELRIKANNVDLLTITIPKQEVRGGTSNFTVTGYLNNNKISEWWVTHLRNGEKTNVSVEGYVLIGEVGKYVNVPVKYSTIIKTHIFPIKENLNRKVSLGPLGDVVISKALVTLEDVSSTSTKLRTSLTIQNDLRIPLVVGDIAYSVTLPNGEEVAEGYVSGLTTIPSGSERNVVIPVTINNDAIPKLWYYIVEGKGQVNLSINVWFKVTYGSKTIEILKNHPISVEVTVNAPIMKFK